MKNSGHRFSVILAADHCKLKDPPQTFENQDLLGPFILLSLLSKMAFMLFISRFLFGCLGGEGIICLVRFGFVS